MSRIKNINNICKKLLNEIDNPLGNIAGSLVTTLARASGIPVVAGIGDFLGSQTNKAVVGIFDKLINKKKDIPRKIRSNDYFYKDDYIKYQSGIKGYDTEIPKDRLNPSDTQRIKQYLYPSFLKFGYNLKVIGERSSEKSLIAILFKDGSRLPIMDSRRNPVVYPIPTDVFNNIKDKESSDIAVYDLLKLYQLEISNI